MKHRLIPLLGLLLLMCSCKTAQLVVPVYQTDSLVIEKIAPHTYIHTSFLQTESFGLVPCNGMIVIDHGEAIVLDTPHNDTVSLELIRWIEKEQQSQVKAIVPTHFHADCLGGLHAFHQHGIPSYAYQKTLELAAGQDATVPQNGFEGTRDLSVGQKKVQLAFVGEGHTRDNIVAYFPSEKILFGGCLIKALKAGKGHLADANVEAWPATVQRVKAQFGQAKMVIPGHGKVGDTALLDYTIQLFQE
ncbi:MAG TPA: subclass B1 metallo-beta-lactamase [Saprospiraceae bacterium]|nr:subclass B1 metallo-beta-lactamase [Saprospiraceae bacterium]HMQ81595.1 subclass B1 metallo-beta-lactamase [Saprospiraceae bacterium]